jgi:quinate dehydrogenase
MLEVFLRGSNGEDGEEEGEEEEGEEEEGEEEERVPGKKDAEEEDKEKGVFLDMCFKPRVTRQIKLARRYGWRTVEGTEIIGHQIEEQWRLWTGRVLTGPQQEEAWAVLRTEAEASRAINF